MSGKQARVVNVIPNAKIKRELTDDEDEESVECRICGKAFATPMALGNHARMEHMAAYATGDPSEWTQPPEAKMVVEVDPDEVRIKTEELISSMTPTNVMSLASQDVSYIIIKAEAPDREKEKKRKREKREELDVQKPEKISKKEKEVQPITGPFECLQPSTLVADGTCHQIFFSCCEYSLHFRDEHTRRRKGLRCQVCEKPLLAAGEEPRAPYPCEVCGMGFQTNKELSQHMAIDHVKLKPFECSVCHKRFTQQGGVQQHMRMHTGDRPFPCTFCPKAFTQKSGLDQHLRIHTKVKPYRCVICSKTFCQSVHLKQHMRTHTNVSPFQCGICSKRFKQSSHLNYHLKNHNPQNMTEDQKVEYYRLINLMKRDEERKMVYVNSENGHYEEVPVSVEASETSETEVIEETEVLESEIIMDETTEQEQILAEQSIQVEEGQETYILSDTGNEVWSVKMVDS